MAMANPPLSLMLPPLSLILSHLKTHLAWGYPIIVPLHPHKHIP